MTPDTPWKYHVLDAGRFLWNHAITLTVLAILLAMGLAWSDLERNAPVWIPQAPLPPSEKQADLLKQVREEARRLQEAGSYLEAKKAYLTAAELAPEDPTVLAGLATCFLELDQFHLALGTWKQLCTLDPQHVEAPRQVARLMFNSGQYQDALPYGRSAVSNQVTCLDANLQLARIYHKLSQPDLALRYVDNARDQGSTQVEYLNRIAFHYALVDAPDRAEAVYRQALEMDARQVGSYAGLAAIARYRGELSEAARLLEVAVEIDGRDIQIKNQFAEVALARRDWPKAIELFESILHLDPRQFEVETRLAEAELAAGRREAGFTRARRMIESGHVGAMADGHHVMARGYHRLGLYSMALEHADHCLLLRPEFLQARLARAQSLLSLGRLHTAIDTLETLVEQHPALLPARLLLARAYQMNGEPRKALFTLQETMQAFPDRSEALHMLARYQEQAGQPDAAILLYESLLRIEPGDPVAAKRLAELLAAAGLEKHHRQIAALAQSLLARGKIRETASLATRLSQSPNPRVRQEGQHLLSIWHFAQHQYAPALVAAEQVLALQPDHTRALIKQAQCLYQLKRYPAAVKSLKRLIRIHPENVYGVMLLGHVLIAQGRQDDGILCLRRAHKMNPASTLPALELAKVHHQNQDWNAALGYYRSVLDRNPYHLLAGNSLVNLIFDRGEEALYEEAMAAAERMRRQHPGHPLVANMDGWILYHQRDLEAARTQLERAALELPEASEVHYHLASVCLLQGDHDTARASLERALDGAHAFAGVKQAQNLLSMLRRRAPPAPIEQGRPRRISARVSH